MAECSCGCGKETSGGLFRPGHDQKLRGHLERRTGNLHFLAKLVDVAEAHANGETSAEALSQQVRTIFQTARSRPGV